jgi:hypothetical protein
MKDKHFFLRRIGSQRDWRLFENKQKTELFPEFQMQIDVRMRQCNSTWIEKCLR